MAEKKDRVKPTLGKSASVRGKPPVKPGAPTKSGGSESQTTARAKGADNQNGKNDVGSTGKQNWTKLMTSRYVKRCRQTDGGTEGRSDGVTE